MLGRPVFVVELFLVLEEDTCLFSQRSPSVLSLVFSTFVVVLVL